MDENYLPSRIALARFALAKGQADVFAKQRAKLSAQAPENPNVLLLRAASANRNGDSTEAVKLAEKAFTLAPGTTTALALDSQKKLRVTSMVHFSCIVPGQTKTRMMLLSE